MAEITGTLHEDVFTFMIISRRILIRMRNISDKSYREKTHILRSITFCENRTVYEVISKNVVEPEATNDNIIWRMRFPCWIRLHAHASAHPTRTDARRVRTCAQYVRLLFHGNTGFAKVPQCYIICALPVLF